MAVLHIYLVSMLFEKLIAIKNLILERESKNLDQTLKQKVELNKKICEAIYPRKWRAIILRFAIYFCIRLLFEMLIAVKRHRCRAFTVN